MISRLLPVIEASRARIASEMEAMVLASLETLVRRMPHHIATINFIRIYPYRIIHRSRRPSRLHSASASFLHLPSHYLRILLSLLKVESERLSMSSHCQKRQIRKANPTLSSIRLMLTRIKRLDSLFRRTDQECELSQRT